jgi:GDP-L-fucose synthase
LHVDDATQTCLLFWKKSAGSAINIGVGDDQTIKELAEMVREAVAFEGEVQWDTTKPDGTQRKTTRRSRIRAIGWKPRIDLKKGIREVYAGSRKIRNTPSVRSLRFPVSAFQFTRSS